MKLAIIVLLTGLSTISHAAEKILLTDFLNGIRHQLLGMENRAGDQSTRTIIKNVHVEMHVIAEKNQQGKTAYYVLEGMVDKKDVVTQKLSLDLELQHSTSRRGHDSAYKSYSTRKKDYTYGPDRYRSSGQYPYPPDPYMPDIYPVIMFDKER
jgi:hypothetical protein